MADSSLEKLNLYHYGTLRWQPSPNTIYTTVVDNLLRFKRRPEIKHLRAAATRAGASAKHQGNAQGVAFLIAHLSRAVTPSDVIRAAIKGISDGRKSRNVETLLIYQDLDALQRALEIAQAAERDDSGATSEAAQ